MQCSLALESSQKPHDSHCGGWAGFRDWDAVSHGQQYAPFETLLVPQSRLNTDTAKF